MVIIIEKKGDLFKCPIDSSMTQCVSVDFKIGIGITKIFKQKFGNVDNLMEEDYEKEAIIILCYIISLKEMKILRTRNLVKRNLLNLGALLPNYKRKISQASLADFGSFVPKIKKCVNGCNKKVLRRGPNGIVNLCNACGLRYKKYGRNYLK